MNRIAIFSVGDAGYLPVQLIALNGIKQVNTAYDYIALVPSGNRDTAAWRHYEDQLGIRIMEVDFDEYFHDRGFRFPWPLECLMWFIAPSLLQDLGYSHSLYVDGDILCLRPLDFGDLADRQESIVGIDNGTAFHQLAHIDCIEQLLGRKLALGNTVTNTGVLFFRHADLVKSLFTKRVIELYEQCWPWGLREPGDQSLLALYIAVHNFTIGLADPSWNLRLYPDKHGHNHRQLRSYYQQNDTPRMIHFLGGKPWTDPPTAQILYRYYVQGIAMDLWNSAAPARIQAANRWRNLAVETLGADCAARVFGKQVLGQVKMSFSGAVHGHLLESLHNHRARRIIRERKSPAGLQ